jgi:hypothetical protein
MANYVAHARSNYFAVIDPTAFLAFCDRWSLEAITSERDGVKLHGFLCEEGLPSEPTDSDAADTDTADFKSELAALLADSAVAVMQEVGHEAMRFVNGYALAINNKGDCVHVALDDIFDAAAALGTHITQCEF